MGIDRRPSSGFTLLEVMMALFFLALGLMAAIRVGGQMAVVETDLRDATHASWVAANTLEQTRLSEPWPEPGRRRGEALMGYKTWYWEMTINGTEDADLRRMDVKVFHDVKREFGVVTLTGFIGRTGRQP